MRRSSLAFFTALFLTACQGALGTDPADDTTDSDTDAGSATDTDPADDTDPTDDSDDTDDTDPPVETDFTHALYRLDEARVIETAHFDMDGDGTDDNALPTTLAAAGALIPGLSLAEFNDDLQDAIDDHTIALAIDAELSAKGVLRVGFLPATYDDDKGTATIDPAGYDEKGVPVQHLLGEMTSATDFEGGPGELDLPIVFAGVAFTLEADDAQMGGTLDEQDIDMLVGVLLPTEQLYDEVLSPLLTVFLGDDASSYAPLVETVLANAADVEGTDGTTYLSATLRFQGVALPAATP